MVVLGGAAVSHKRGTPVLEIMARAIDRGALASQEQAYSGALLIVLKEMINSDVSSLFWYHACHTTFTIFTKASPSACDAPASDGCGGVRISQRLARSLVFTKISPSDAP